MEGKGVRVEVDVQKCREFCSNRVVARRLPSLEV